MRILLAEDDLVATQMISLALKAVHIFIDHVDQGEEAIEMVRHYEYDIVLVGLTLPDMDGRHLVRRLRAAKHTAPILVLGGAHTTASIKVEAFDAGTDDFLTLPVDPSELLARIQAVLRRSKGFSNPIIRIGVLQLNTNTHEVSYDGHEVRLTSKEFAILELLVVRKGQVLTKTALLNHLYGGIDEPDGKIVDVFICKLRKKLQAVGGSDLISTVWGRGYVLQEGTAALAALAAFDGPIAERDLILAS